MWVLWFTLLLDSLTTYVPVGTYPTLAECQESLVYVEAGMKQAYPDSTMTFECKEKPHVQPLQ